MIEVVITYDFLPTIDQKAYVLWLKKAVLPVITQHGIVEIRAYRSYSGSPKVAVVIVWGALADWNKFELTEHWNTILNELKEHYAENINIQVWLPSPIAPDPLRPAK